MREFIHPHTLKVPFFLVAYDLNPEEDLGAGPQSPSLQHFPDMEILLKFMN